MMEDREATQRFTIRHSLIQNCGQTLTPDNVDRIVDEIIDEMQNGACSWAFKEKINVV